MRNFIYLAAALILAAAATIFSGQTVSAAPASTVALQQADTANPNIQKAWYREYYWYGPCCWGSYGYWHNRWRSHYRWGSYGGWYDPWWDHYRWYHGYWHDRWRSHYRWGSHW